MCPEAYIDLPAGPRAGSGLLQAGWVYRLWHCGFLASGVCPLVGGAGPEARAGCLEGRTRACPQVLKLGPGLWWAGLCLEECLGLREALGSLSADGWVRGRVFLPS